MVKISPIWCIIKEEIKIKTINYIVINVKYISEIK